MIGDVPIDLDAVVVCAQILRTQICGQQLPTGREKAREAGACGLETFAPRRKRLL
jgi:hypothetical protein